MNRLLGDQMLDSVFMSPVFVFIYWAETGIESVWIEKGGLF